MVLLDVLPAGAVCKSAIENTGSSPKRLQAVDFYVS
jgi:hypothetical protein